MKLRELLEKKNAEYLDTNVTNMGKHGYGIQLIDKKTKKVWDETKVKTKKDIGPAIKDMMRNHDKLGGTSKMADKSRHRNK